MYSEEEEEEEERVFIDWEQRGDVFSGTTHRVRVSREAKTITGLSSRESTSEGNRVGPVLVRLR